MATLKMIRLKVMKKTQRRKILMDMEGLTEDDIACVDHEDRPTLHQTLGIAYYNLSIEYEYT